MEIMRCTVRRQLLDVDVPTLVALTYDYINVKATFSSEWAGMQKWLHIRNVEDQSIIAHVLFNNDEIGEDVGLNLSAGEWDVWIHGALYEDNTLIKRITTNVKKIKVEATGSQDEILPSIGPSVAEQAVAAAERAEAAADEAEASASAAEGYSTSAEDSATRAQLSAANANVSANEAANRAFNAAHAATSAQNYANLAAEAVSHYPKIENDYWYVWDAANETWGNTNVLAKGATFTPAVDSYGNLSWTNNAGLPNPPTVNLVSLFDSVPELQARMDEILAEAEAGVADIEEQRDTILASIAAAAALGTDTTLTVSGMAADAKATGDAINDLKSYTTSLKYSKTTGIPANSDLNDYKTPGNYRVSTVNSRTLANAPEQSNARIFVLTRISDVTVNQIWLSEQSLYVRGYTSGTWQAWRNATQLTDTTLTESGVPADSATVGTNSLITRTSLSSGDDCNNLNIGAYFKDGGVTVLNGVDSSMAMVVCFTPDSRPYGKVQLWINCSYKKIYFRAAGSRSGGNTRWSDWKQLATMSDIVSIDDTLSMPGYAADAAKVGKYLNKADIYDGFIFRLSENPEPIPVGASHISYAQLISMWDSLMNDVNYLAEKTYHQGNNFEDTVTKTKVGESTTTDSITTGYDIFQYVFEPRNPEFTVFLTSGCDGDEYEAYWSLYRFMHTLYFEGYKYPNLRNLRHRIRFVCVPAYNPWGVDNGVRNCPLGFQTLDNLNKSVTVGSTTYPAFTSKECQAIRDCLNGLQESYGTINLWVDIHTDPYSVTHDWKKGFYGYAPTGSPINKVLYGLTIDFDNLIKAETGSDTDFTIYNSSASATNGMPGYGTGRGIPTALIETTIGEFYDAVGGTSRMVSGSAKTMKYAQEWYWNVIANMICAI